MRIAGPGEAHLFYCLNAYPARTVAELQEAVFTRAAAVWAQTRLPGPHAVGLWLNAGLLPELDVADLAARLRDAGLYCLSLNGFPYGVFHQEEVKQRVYTPDWSRPERLDYTLALARTLAQLLPEGQLGSISTLPLCYRGCANPALIAAATEHLRDAARFLRNLHQRTGKEICLALEPEPDCFLDDSSAAARWIDETLLQGGEELRPYLGVCLDTVHALVQFEHPTAALQEFVGRGIRVPKLQIGGALAAEVTAQNRLAVMRELSAFADPVYLHQTRIRMESRDGRIRSFSDLPPALAEAAVAEWRIHFHVPLCWNGHGALSCARSGLDRAFFSAARAVGVRHLEVEIYTVSVFPDRSLSAAEIFARELSQLASQLQ